MACSGAPWLIRRESAMTESTGKRFNSAATRKLSAELKELITEADGFINLKFKRLKRRTTAATPGEPYLVHVFHPFKNSCGSLNDKGSV